ncbi:MAG: hypothetical protein OXI83_05800, partial [Gemmatimonadota bacterium]|nr:hypothetical protein [Gemmatimonadota bacterium]
KLIFALIAVVTMATLVIVWRRRSVGAPSIGLLDRFSGTAARIFVLAAIVRFIVPVFVIVSYFAGQALLQRDIDSQRAELSTISEQVLSEDQENLDQSADDENGLEGQNAQDPATEERGSFIERAFIEPARDAVNRVLPDIRSRVLPDISMPDLSVMSVLLERAVSLAEDLTRLLVLIAVKNIVLPLMFLLLALKFIRPVTMGLLAMTSAIERDLKDIKETAKEIGSGDSSALPKP